MQTGATDRALQASTGLQADSDAGYMQRPLMCMLAHKMQAQHAEDVLNPDAGDA